MTVPAPAASATVLMAVLIAVLGVSLSAVVQMVRQARAGPKDPKLARHLAHHRRTRRRATGMLGLAVGGIGFLAGTLALLGGPAGDVEARTAALTLVLGVVDGGFGFLLYRAT